MIKNKYLSTLILHTFKFFFIFYFILYIRFYYFTSLLLIYRNCYLFCYFYYIYSYFNEFYYCICFYFLIDFFIKPFSLLFIIRSIQDLHQEIVDILLTISFFILTSFLQYLDKELLYTF